jgi:hypothetical protein
MYSSNTQEANNAVENIGQLQAVHQTAGSLSGAAIQFDPATAESLGNSGINIQGNSVQVRGTTGSWNTQVAGNAVGCESFEFRVRTTMTC